MSPPTVSAAPTQARPGRRLLQGSEAIAEAMVAAGCRFFAGYPMTPFTEVLEEMAKRLPSVGGVCMNAESELEAVGMAWGAAATGMPAATGSTGQGLSLMQESLAEITLARIPLVVLNMARAQGDYWQATRGGGHGDYRHLVFAPVDVAEAVELIPRAFHLAAAWRNPVVILGDYYLAHTARAVDVPLPDLAPRPPADWALTGESGGSGRAKLVSFLGSEKQRDGVRVGWVRPVTLVPFPSAVIASAARRAKAVAVYENNSGQMLDDVRLAVLGEAPVEFIGGLSLDASGFGIAPDLDVSVLRDRILGVVERHA